MGSREEVDWSLVEWPWATFCIQLSRTCLFLGTGFGEGLGDEGAELKESPGAEVGDAAGGW